MPRNITSPQTKQLHPPHPPTHTHTHARTHTHTHARTHARTHETHSKLIHMMCLISHVVTIVNAKDTFTRIVLKCFPLNQPPATSSDHDVEHSSSEVPVERK
jgi:hypothetical protein